MSAHSPEVLAKPTFARSLQLGYERIAGHLRPVEIFSMTRKRSAGNTEDVAGTVGFEGDYMQLRSLMRFFEDVFQTHGGMHVELTSQVSEKSEIVHQLLVKPGSHMTAREFADTLFEFDQKTLIHRLGEAAGRLHQKIDGEALVKFLPHIVEGIDRGATTVRKR